MTIEDPKTGQDAPNLQAKAGAELNEATEKAKHDLEAVSRRAKEDVRHLGEQASEKVGEATEQAKSFAGDQKNLAAAQVTGVADAINKVASELDGTDQKVVARYARDIASGLSQMGKTIEERDVDDLMGMAQDFGRRQPVAFLGAAALAGFVASRFALASTHRREAKAADTTSYASPKPADYSAPASKPSSGYASATSSSSYQPATPGQNRTGGL